MKKLNLKTTKLFLSFLLKLKGLSEIILSVKDHPHLLVKEGQTMHTNDGPSYLLSIGTLIDRRSEKYEYCMQFLVIDRRSLTGLSLDISIFPVSTKDDLNDVEETCVIIEGNKVSYFIINLQRAHANRAHSWLLELKTAGYLK